MKTYHDIEGDGGSKILEQVREQRARIASRLEGVRHLVAVGSGKGGVGKSTLTMQLAATLRADGSEVAILDADINGPSQARLGGLMDAPLVPGPRGLTVPRNAAGIGIVSLGSLVPETRAVEFDSVADGESHTWRATREFSALTELLGALDWGVLDTLLVDLPPGAERTVQYADFFGPRLSFVLVTVPSDLARGVVRRSVAALRQSGHCLLGYVENMAGYYCDSCGEVKPLFPSSGDAGLELDRLGEVPFDPRVASLGDRGRSIVGLDDSPAAAAIAGIARRLTDRLEDSE